MKISGNNAVLSSIQNGHYGLVYIHAKHSLYTKLKELEHNKKCIVHIKPLHFFKQEQIRQNICLTVQSSITQSIPSIKKWLEEKKDNDTKSMLVLILDHIQDAQNFGAIFRSAALFSADLIVCPQRRTAPINEHTVRSAAGTISLVPFCTVTNLSNSVSLLKEHGFWIHSLDMKGESIYDFSFALRSACILGSEGLGVSHVLKEHSDHMLRIPTNDVIDSLNVSVSNGILCYEYRKQFPVISS